MWPDKTNSLIPKLIKPGTNSLKVKKSSFKKYCCMLLSLCKMLYKRMKINKLHNSVFRLLCSWNKMAVNDMYSRIKAVGTTVPTKVDVYLELSKPIKLLKYRYGTTFTYNFERTANTCAESCIEESNKNERRTPELLSCSITVFSCFKTLSLYKTNQT